MKAWTFIIIFLSLCGKLMKNFLPRSEKSPLFAPLRFLLSLSVIVALVSPLMNPGFGNKREKVSFEYDAPELDGYGLILEKMGKSIKHSVDTAFPDCEYSLEIYTDDQGMPSVIYVIGGEERAAEIADFIGRNYGLKTATA